MTVRQSLHVSAPSFSISHTVVCSRPSASGNDAIGGAAQTHALAASSRGLRVGPQVTWPAMAWMNVAPEPYCSWMRLEDRMFERLFWMANLVVMVAIVVTAGVAMAYVAG
jgi:hypothetical protein